MKPKTKKSVILFASLALVLGFAAAELQKSVRVVVSTGTAKGQPDVAYDAQAERYLVVWQERSGSGDDRDIKARVVNRDGTPASDIVALASSGEDERLPKTAATGSSSWMVVWSTGTSIEACTVDATGKAADFRTVDSGASRPVDRPDIGAAGPDGALLVVWEELDETGLTVIMGRRIRGAAATDGEEFLLARSPECDLRHPSVNQSGNSSFVAWEKPVEVRRVDVEGRLVPADAASPLDLGEVISIAADGVQNTLPSVTAFSGTDAFLVVWQSSDGRRDSDISFAGVTGLGIQTSGKLTNTSVFRETRPSASSIGIAGRVLVTYQIAPSDKPRLREIAARTIGWGDSTASAEMALDPTRAGGGNPASVAAAGAGGRGLVAWDVADGEGTSLYSKEWLASELSTDGLPPDIDGPIVPLADVTISGMVTFNGVAQADVLLSGFPIAVRTDATGAYSAYVPAPWSGTVTPVQPGFTFSPASNTYTDVNADVTGQNYTAVFVGGAEDIYEDNDNFASAAELPLGTTHDLILNDEEWFKILVPPADAGKVLRIRIWGTGFPDTTTRRDLDFAILDASGKLLTYNTSGLHDETAFVCDVVAGYYYVTQSYFETPGTVYSLTAELSDAFGLGYVTGQVTDDDGQPIEGATVELLGVTLDWWTVNNPLVITDADGNYKIGFYPGQYTIRFNGSEFGNDGYDWTFDTNYLAEMYNWGEVVTLESNVTLPDIDGVLTPGGVIAGTIRDSQGSPYTNARAYVYSSDTVMNRSALTDATGGYTVNRLRAGNFAVRLRNSPGALTQEWYDGHADFASADPVGAEAEIPTSGVDALLEEGPWGAIAGTVTDADLNPVSNLPVAVVDPAGISLWSANTDPSGHYALTRVPAGTWKVSFNAGSIGTAFVPQYYPGTRLIGDAATVQVVAGETTDGIDATLAAAGSISGTVFNNAGAVSIIAFDTATLISRSVTVNPILPTYGPPTYAINNLPPGTYKVLARPNMQGVRMLHWYPDAASYADAGTVTVTAGAVTSGIDITLATGGALITGRVLDMGGYPIAGVVAVAQDASVPVGYASAPSNEEGYYTIRQVPVPTGTSGSVKVYFNTNANWLSYSSEYHNDKADHGTADGVTVNEGATTTVPDAALDLRPALALSTASLPAGEVAVAYSQQLAATGGRTFYRWSISSGALPPGLVLNSRGEISGTPTMTGTFNFIVDLTDSSYPQQSWTSELSITVGAYTGEGFTISGTVTELGSPLAGVRIEGLPGEPVTSATGTYVAVVEPAFWDTVTPVLSGYAFDPPFRTYAVVTGNLYNQDYSAQPGYRLAGTITVNGAPLSGVRLTGLPTEIRTDERGDYSIMLPSGWSGSVTPILAGFSFSPPSTSYGGLLGDALDQDYTATYAGGGEDLYENNDTFEAAAVVTMGTVIRDLVLNDQDWFKFEVPPGDAGKTLGVRLQATAFPNGTAVSDPAHNKDLDFGIMDEAGKLLTYSMSGSIDEVAFIPDIQPGWYTIGHTYMINPGMVYSLFVTTSDALPLGTISGRITNEDEQGIDGVTVQLFKLPFDWNDSHPMAITDADGNYKIAAFPGDYQVKVGLQDFDQNPNDGLPDGWVPVRNYLPNSYDYDRTVSLAPGTPVTGADVTLEWAGAISGRVTDGEGNPLQFVRVNTFLAGGIQANAAYTDADGNYEIRHLRSANFALLFRPPAGSPLAREWYNDLDSYGASLPVPATAETTTTGIDAVLETGGQISGHVRNEVGDPIQGVTAVALDPSGTAMQAANSQSDGSYVLNSLREGSYKIVFNPVNCYPGNFLFREYNSGEPVPVADGQTTPDIDAVMYPAGAIIGRLSDQDNDGLMSGSVQAFSASTGDMWAATIDYTGNYTIRNLPPGNYRVRFAYAFGSITNYPPKWYPTANSGTDAAVLTVAAGETLNGIDGVLGADGGGISGRVTNTVGGGIAGISVLAEDGSFGEFAASQALTDADGYYTVQNVPTGTARVVFQTGFRPYNSEFYNDKASYGGADAVPIAQATVQSDIDAVLSIRPSLAMVTASLPNGEQGVAYAQTLTASGGFAFYHWSINSGSLPPGLELNSRGEISGTPTLPGAFHFMVDLTDSSYPQQSWTSELSITVGEYAGIGYTISGTATADATPLAGVTLMGLPGSPVTNVAGSYIAVVPSGWNGTVTPVRSGFAFTPATITYANVSADFSDQNYTAVAGYTISGTVRLDGAGQAGVIMSGLPGDPLTDASGAYSASVGAGWDGTVTPTLPGFTFAPANIPYTDVSADMTGQDYVSTYAGGVDDPFEDNDSFETAATVPLGTTSSLVLRDDDWFRVYVPSGDAGKDLRVHIWGTSYPDQTSPRDIDFYVRNSAGTALSLNLSGSPNETAYICDVAEGWYYIGQMYIGLEGTVYSISLDLNEDFGLGYVEGTVRDDGGTPIPGVSVELYGDPFDWNVSRPLIYTDAAGHYRIGYTPGPYTVRFNLAAAERDTLEWTPDANFIGEVYNDGEVVQVAAGTTTSGIDGQLSPGGGITGTVTDSSGNPFLNAWVYAYAGDSVNVAVNLTNADGYYSLNRLRPGNYAVRFRPTGPASLAVEWYDDAGSFAAAMPVAVVAGTTTDGIDAAFGTPGAISGRVTNASGDPIVGVQVTAYDPEGIALQSSTTDSNGYYFVPRLPAGSFKILFNAAPATNGNYVTKYYPEGFYLNDAEFIDVLVGGPTDGIDGVLEPAGTITGTVTDGAGQPRAGVNVHAFGPDGYFVLSTSTDATGAYAIRNLPPDDYKVRFRPASDDLTVEWNDDKADFTGADAVTVAAGATVSGIDAELEGGGGLITGRVTNEMGAPIAGLLVVAQDTAIPAAFHSTVTDADGNYTLRRMPTCQAKVWFNADAGYLNYFSEYHSDKGDHGSADAVNVTAGETTAGIDAVLAEQPALTVTTGGLAMGELAVEYGGSVLESSGGRPFYHWSLESGALPDGLVMNGRGEISGTPTMAGTFTFTVRVSDSTAPQQVATRELSITIGEYAGIGHSISGRVMLGAAPLSGVTMTGLPGNPTTNSAGSYVAVVPDGWSGTATPVLTGYVFDPVSYPYSNVTASLTGQDFAASLGYTISGIVTFNSAPLEGVLMSGLPENPVTDTMGYYRAAVTPGWSGTVTPTLAGFTFTPATQTYTNVLANIADQDYAATAVAPRTAKVDFNGDGQEDILWRYQGAGTYQGLNVAWLMHQSAVLAPEPMLAGQPAEKGMTTLLGQHTGAISPVPIQMTRTRTLAPMNPVKSILTGKKMRGLRPAQVSRSPIDRGQVSTAKERRRMKDEVILPLDGPKLKDAATPEALISGTMELAALQINTEVILSSVPDTDWEIAGTADFDGDGDTDILWRYYGLGDYRGLNDIWFMNGTSFAGESVFSQVHDTNWRIVGTGDFDGDGDADILWRYYGTGDYTGLNVIWYMNGSQFSGETVFNQVQDTDWKIAGTGDFNGDGDTDILWRYYGTGAYQGLNVVWYMNGSLVTGESVFSQVHDTNWQIAGTGDFNSDGNVDILWRYYGTGDYQGLNVIWHMTGTSVSGEEVFSQLPDTNWRIVNR